MRRCNRLGGQPLPTNLDDSCKASGDASQALTHCSSSTKVKSPKTAVQHMPDSSATYDHRKQNQTVYE